MRRLSLALGALSALLFAVALVPSGSAGAAGDSARGLVYDGMRPDAGLCRGAFRMSGPAGQAWCSHGPDAAPAGVDVRSRRAPEAAATPPTAGTALAGGGVQCYGNGSDGYRVQLIYARAADRPDRYAQYKSSFVQWAGATDSVFDLSAGETGGSRHVRFVTDGSCAPVIDNVVLSNSGDNNFTNTYNELRAKGYGRTDRKYLVWMDANVYCGIAQVYDDDRPTQDNYSNGSSLVSGEIARVDNGCWGYPGQSVEAHELMHTMGGVQTSAPHATRNSHCWDESDRMCYADGSGVAMRQICPTSHENSFDCNHDDYYFAGSPSSGNYLATHWNVANSVFLSSQAGSSTGSPPPSTTAPGPPQNLTAKPPATGSGVKLAWQAPGSDGGSPLTGYDVYRRTATGSYALIKSLTPDRLAFRDQTTSAGTVYYYVVKGKNATGVSAPSNEASQTAR